MNESAESEVNSLGEIDRVLHEPARMQICALLYMLESADFIFIMNQTGLTWGNLSAHLSKLESAAYVEINKSFHGKRPKTSISLTEQGRMAFKEYTLKMRSLFNNLPI